MPTPKVIWIASYPKSGNTWIRTLLRNYLELLTGTKPGETNDTVPYFYHIVSPVPVGGLTYGEVAQLRPAAMMHIIALHESRSHPTPATLIKTHNVSASFDGVPFFSTLWSPKVIYIYRDPRDILPSYADHMGKTHEETLDLMNSQEAYVGTPPSIPALTSTWSNHVNSWFGNDAVSTCVMSYEELHNNTEGILKMAIEFCDFPYKAPLIQAAVEASDFKVLRGREDILGFAELGAGEKFFRRGIVGSHVDECSDVAIARVERDQGDMMRQLGYLDD